MEKAKVTHRMLYYTDEKRLYFIFHKREYNSLNIFPIFHCFVYNKTPSSILLGDLVVYLMLKFNTKLNLQYLAHAFFPNYTEPI